MIRAVRKNAIVKAVIEGPPARKMPVFRLLLRLLLQIVNVVSALMK